MRFDEHFVRAVLPQVSFLASTFAEDVRFSVDTRTLQPGDIFFALSGASVDGHAFVQEAFARGAAGIVIQESKKECVMQLDKNSYAHALVMMVPNTHDALIALARAWRAQFSYPVVAVTGSAGKTSTKQLLASMFHSASIAYCVAKGSHNTDVGIALTMIRMRPEHKAAIFEVGINKQGEMAKLAEFLRPTHAIITGIGHAHMEGLGTLADIAAEKRAIFHCFTEQNIGFINSDQPLLADVGYRHPVVKFGTKTSNQVQARKIQTDGSTITFVLKLYKKKYAITLPHAHMGMVYNVLAASAAAYILGIKEEAILQGISQFEAVSGRFEHKRIRDNRGILINDCHNANPESMKVALQAFQLIDTKAKKIAILGDMLELGSYAPFWHRQIGRFLRQTSSITHVILVGNLIQWTKKTAPVGLQVDVVPTWREAAARLQELLHEESMVLVKGSNGMKLGNLVQEMT